MQFHFQLLRHWALRLVLSFSTLILIFSIWFAIVTGTSFLGIVPNFLGLEIAVSVMTLAAIVGLSLTYRLRPKSPVVKYTSLVSVELGWTGLFWILWLSAAGQSATDLPSYGDCQLVFGIVPDVVIGVPEAIHRTFQPVCITWPFVIAFSFFNWVIFMAWFGILIYYGFKGKLWMSNVSDIDSVIGTGSKAGNANGNSYLPSTGFKANANSQKIETPPMKGLAGRGAEADYV